MSKEKPTRSRFFGLMLLIGCLAITGLQGSMYLTMVDRTVGSIPFIGTKSAHQVPDMEVALLKSRLTAQLNKEHPEYYYDLPAQWELALKESGIQYHIIRDEDLAGGVPPGSNVLVLPMVSCLSDSMRASIRKFIGSGGGVVASGALGSRDENGKWLGFDFLEEVTRLQHATIELPAERSYATFRGDEYFSQLLPPGFRLELPRQEVTSGILPTADSYLSDYRLNPVTSNGGKTAVSLHGIRGNGRYVWFGFSETLPGRPASDRKYLDHFMTTSVRWAAKQPVAVLGSWPGKNKAAALVMEDIEGDVQDARGTIQMLKSENVPATFFLRAADAKAASPLIQQMTSLGEVATSGDTGEPFAEDSRLRQLERLNLSQSALQQYTTTPIVGFNPPNGLYDAATVTSLRDAGYTYYLDNNELTSAVPEVVESIASAMFPLKKVYLARISRTGVDDIEAVADYKGPTPWADDMADVFLSDFQRIYKLGGVYTLSFTNALLGSTDNLHIPHKVIREIKKQPVWFTTAQRLAQWWAQRENVRVETRMVHGTRIRLAVTNRGQETMHNASLTLHMPYKPKNVRIIPIVLEHRVPTTQMNAAGDMLRLDFAELRGQSSHVFLLALDEK